MSKSFNSPFASAFKSAIKNGTPCGIAVNNIAKRNSKTSQNVFTSLYKAGHCQRQKFNGQWIYWPTNWSSKSNATQKNECQINMWQCFVDWCLASGFCTPEKLDSSSSQKEFMNFCKKFFAKQYSAGNSSKSSSRTRSSSSSKRSSAKASKRSATPKKRTGTKRTSSPKAKRSIANKAKRSTSTSSKRTASPKAKRSTTIKAKRSASFKAKSRTMTRKSNARKSSPSSYKFPTSRRTSTRKAA